jgi:ribokinase
VLNPAPVIPAVAGLLRHRPVLTPNSSESADLAELLDGASRDGADAAHDPVLASARTIVRCSRAPVVVTLGGDGVMVLVPGGEPERIPSGKATVRDTTGAGDTFNGVLAARLAAGDELGVAVRLATVAASLSVAHVGARTGMPRSGSISAALPAL